MRRRSLLPAGTLPGHDRPLRLEELRVLLHGGGPRPRSYLGRLRLQPGSGPDQTVRGALPPVRPVLRGPAAARPGGAQPDRLDRPGDRATSAATPAPRTTATSWFPKGFTTASSSPWATGRGCWGCSVSTAPPASRNTGRANTSRRGCSRRSSPGRCGCASSRASRSGCARLVGKLMRRGWITDYLVIDQDWRPIDSAGDFAGKPDRRGRRDADAHRRRRQTAHRQPAAEADPRPSGGAGQASAAGVRRHTGLAARARGPIGIRRDARRSTCSPSWTGTGAWCRRTKAAEFGITPAGTADRPRGQPRSDHHPDRLPPRHQRQDGPAPPRPSLPQERQPTTEPRWSTGFPAERIPRPVRRKHSAAPRCCHGAARSPCMEPP